MKFRNSFISLVSLIVVAGVTVIGTAPASAGKAAKTIAFASANYNVTEGDTAAITITRSVSHGPASVAFATSDGTAGSSHYGSVTTTVSFKSGQSTATASVTSIKVGDVPSSGLTVNLTLSSPSRNWALGSANTATLTIYPMPVPIAPTGLSATVVTGLTIPHVALAWNASPTQGVSSYKVYSATTASGPYSVVGNTAATSYDVTPAPRVLTYFVVAAFNDYGVGSTYSNEVSAQPPVIGSGLYWSNFSNGTIMAANPDGTDATALVTGEAAPWGVAVNATNVFWTNETSSGTIMRANLDGSNVTTLVTGQSNPYGIAIDAGHIYWTNYLSGTVMESSLDGADVVTLVSGENEPTALALVGSKLYWTDVASNRIREFDLGGTTAQTVLDNVGAYPFALAANATYLYWAVTGTNGGSDGTIMRADLSGSNVTTLASGQAHPQGIAVGSNNLYWSNANTASITRASLTGGSATTVVSGQSLPAGLAVSS